MQQSVFRSWLATLGLVVSLALVVSSSLQAELLAPLATVSGQPSYNPEQWFLVSNHLHSSTGIGKYKRKGLAKIFKLAKRKGISMVMVTDHNTVAHWYDEMFRKTDGVIPVPGSEWTSSDGHANIIDFQTEDSRDAVVPCDWDQAPSPCTNGINYQSMVTDIHTRSGLVIINHPRLWRHYWPDTSFGADAVEVNGNLSDKSGRKGRAWWHQRLTEGTHLTGMGGSDWHYALPGAGDEPPDHLRAGHQEGQSRCQTEDAVKLGWPKPFFADAVNLVHMKNASVANLRTAILQGHILVQAKPSAPKLFLGADLDGDGSFDEVRAGDTISTGKGPIRFQIRVLDGKRDKLNLYLSWADPHGERVEKQLEIKVTSDDFVTAFESPRGLPGKSFLRGEIGTKGSAISNPIFF
jgi:hypothetical protein